MIKYNSNLICNPPPFWFTCISDSYCSVEQMEIQNHTLFLLGVESQICCNELSCAHCRDLWSHL